MHSFNLPSRLATLFALAIGLSACGGGGDNTEPPIIEPPVQDENHPPVAEAGPDQSVDDGATVTLDASATTDEDGDSLAFTWRQTAGPEVVLEADTGDSADADPVRSFTAPTVPGGTTLTFEVTVDDGEDTATDTVTVTVNDVTAPTGQMTPQGDILGKAEAITVMFSEPINSAAAVLTGTLADEANAAWSDGDTVLTLTPKADDGEWISGSGKDLSISVTDTAGNSANSLDANFLVKLVFENFQAADVVVGQPDMTSEIAETDADSLSGAPYGRALIHNDRLYVSDYRGERVLGFSSIPTANGASADFVIGQPDFTTGTAGTSRKAIDGPQGLSAFDNKLIVTGYSNNRIAIYDVMPTELENSAPLSEAEMAVVVGQDNFTSSGTGCSAYNLDSPEDSIVTPDGKLLVSDTSNSRVLIWNTLPTGNGIPADMVLGQQDFDTCVYNDQDGNGTTDGPAANTLSYPAGVWSDGKKVVVLDDSNNRVLIWNTFPTSNGQPADLVLGQSDFSHSAGNDSDGDDVTDSVAANTIYDPYDGVASNGVQLFVGDSSNNRVLVWNSWPTENHQAADVVLGQKDFLVNARNDSDGDGVYDGTPTEQTLDYPTGVYVHGDKLIVTDNGNYRYLIYTSK